MYTLKSIARRGTALGSAVALVVATLIPTASVFADALNPLTERSLTLSSSSPGWTFTDGSGNSTYAPPNSGANGQKTGNYFDFKVTTPTTPVKTMSFQYCTTSAGNCEIPGNDSTPGTDTASTSDLNANFPGTLTDLEIAPGDFSTVIDAASLNGDVKAVPGYVNNNPKYQAAGGTGDPAEAAKNVAGNYVVMYDNGGTWTQSTGWKIASVNRENADTGSGQISRPTKNYLILANTSGQVFSAGQRVKVLFFATGSNYITNPGAGAFFVKINTYDKEYVASGAGAGQTLIAGLAPTSTANIIDGGVTVANVMNQSIQITTKVLETMEFSVGTVDPDSLSGAELAASDYGSAAHIPCGRILTRMTPSDPQNVLQLGNQGAESSLETAHAYATHSYWRLSSNSSGGATVYYSGHTLSNTSGDEIKPIGNGGAISAPGSEQFGLGIASAALSGTTASPVTPGTTNFNIGSYGVNYAQDRGAPLGNWENGADNGKTGVSSDQLQGVGALYTGTAPALWDATDSNWDYTTTPLNASYHTPRLDPLAPLGAYGSASGRINGTDSAASVGATNATFAFDKMSDTVPRAIASEPNQVVDCVTAKMRYIGNIAATTPAGIYTTKVNYIAAPQY